MRTTASVGSWIVASGTSSTRTSRFPCQTTAFISSPPTIDVALGLRFPFPQWACACRSGPWVRTAMATNSSPALLSLWRDRAPVETDTELAERYDDLVVGAGITGLVTALLLARSGRHVGVVEARDV